MTTARTCRLSQYKVYHVPVPEKPEIYMFVCPALKEILYNTECSASANVIKYVP